MRVCEFEMQGSERGRERGRGRGREREKIKSKVVTFANGHKEPCRFKIKGEKKNELMMMEEKKEGQGLMK